MLVLPLDSWFFLVLLEKFVVSSRLVDDSEWSHLRIEIGIAEKELFILDVNVSIFLNGCIIRLTYNSNRMILHQDPSSAV